MRGNKTSGNMMETWRQWSLEGGEKTEPPFQGSVSLALDTCSGYSVGCPGDAWRGMLEKESRIKGRDPEKIK